MKNPGPVRIALAFVVGIFALIVGGIRIASAISAEEGHGTAGYFVAQSWVCGSRSGCNWVGEFELPGGAVARSGIEFYGSDPGMTAGTVVPAVDTGDPFGVYQPRGSNLWVYGGGFLFLGVVALVGAALMARSLWFWAHGWAGHRGRRPARIVARPGVGGRVTPAEYSFRAG